MLFLMLTSRSQETQTFCSQEAKNLSFDTSCFESPFLEGFQISVRIFTLNCASHLICLQCEYQRQDPKSLDRVQQASELWCLEGKSSKGLLWSLAPLELALLCAVMPWKSCIFLPGEAESSRLSFVSRLVNYTLSDFLLPVLQLA